MRVLLLRIDDDAFAAWNRCRPARRVKQRFGQARLGRGRPLLPLSADRVSDVLVVNIDPEAGLGGLDPASTAQESPPRSRSA
jgi:hypothetical protein